MVFNLPKAESSTHRYDVNAKDLGIAREKLAIRGHDVSKVLKIDRILSESEHAPDHPVTRVLWESPTGERYLTFVDTGE
jgi:hypothetical protein